MISSVSDYGFREKMERATINVTDDFQIIFQESRDYDGVSVLTICVKIKGDYERYSNVAFGENADQISILHCIADILTQFKNDLQERNDNDDHKGFDGGHDRRAMGRPADAEFGRI